MPGKEKLSAAGDKDDLGRGLPATAAGGMERWPCGTRPHRGAPATAAVEAPPSAAASRSGSRS